MAGYTRQASGNIQTGSVINATDFNNEYNSILAAFDASTGHNHDGSTGEGARILEIGPTSQKVTFGSTALAFTASLDIGSTSVQINDLFISDDKKIKFGAGQDASIEYDEASTDTLLFEGANIRIANTNKIIEFRDADLKIHSSADGKLDIDADTELEIVAPTVDIQASTAITLVSDAITFGEAGDTDIVLTFNANTNDGVLTWKEDEDYFEFSDDLLIASTEKIQFRDTAISINSSTDGQLDIDADTELELTSPIVDINASTSVNISNDLKLDSDSAVLGFGADNDTTLTHTDGTGLTLNSTNKLTFGDAASFVQQSGDGVLRIDGEATIDLNASTAVTVSNDLKLDSDSSVLGFGADNDTTLTHTDGTGLTLNSTNKLTFGDAATFIHQSSDGVLTVAGEATIDLNASTAVLVSNDLKLDSDASVIHFGANSEVTLTHVHNEGLTLTHTGTSDNTPIILQLKSEENEITANETIASIEFAAGDESGSDAALVSAGIHAIAEAEFTSSVNATKLVFTTGSSEAADASATAKMTLSSAGLLTIADDLVIKDAGTIGSASDPDAISIASDGKVTFTQDIILKDGVNIGSASDTNAIGISAGGVVSITATTANTNSTDGALTVGGGLGVAADASIGDDLRLISDASVLSFGADSDVTLTHVADTALLLNSTRQLQFGDSGTYIHQSADGVLDLVSDTELELNATTIDINGNVEISGTTTQTGVSTSTAKDIFNAGLSVKNGATSSGFVEFFEDSDNGTNKVTLIGPASTGDVTVTLPSTATTLAGLAVPQEFTASQNFDEQALSDGANIDWNLQTQQVSTVTLGGNRTFNAPSNHVAGLVCVLTIVQDGSGSRTATFNSVFKFTGGSAPTLTTTAAARDILVFISDGTNLREIGRSLNPS